MKTPQAFTCGGGKRVKKRGSEHQGMNCSELQARFKDAPAEIKPRTPIKSGVCAVRMMVIIAGKIIPLFAGILPELGSVSFSHEIPVAH